MSTWFFLLFILNLALASQIKAQQQPYFSTYFTNPGIVNPSLNSTYDNNNVALVYRSQWANGAPTNLGGSNNTRNTGILSLNLKTIDKYYRLLSENEFIFIFIATNFIKKFLRRFDNHQASMHWCTDTFKFITTSPCKFNLILYYKCRCFCFE